MHVPDGFGVNYKAAQANWDTDIAYFRTIALQNIRPHMPGSPQPWNSATNAYWRNCAQYFHNAGFWVTWGTSQRPISTSNWQSLHDSIVSEAQYLQQQGIVIDEFEVGNEYEGAFIQIITSLTQSNGLATVVTYATHGFSNGDSVTITDTNPSGYAGTFTVTVVNSTTFMYSVSSSLASPASSINTYNGTPIYGYAYSITLAQLNANIRQLATDVKAVYKLGQVSYGCFNSNFNGSFAYDDWLANGLGGLDTLSIHPYGNVNTSTLGVSGGGYADIAKMHVFGERCYVSEFNIDAGSTNNTALSDSIRVNQMRTFLQTIQDNGFKKFLVYEWCEYLNNSSGDLGFIMQNNDGSLTPMFTQAILQP